MRKRLGSSGKAPVQKLEQAVTGSTFALISCFIALVVSFFGVRFGVDFLNFLERNTDGDIFIGYKDQPVMITQGVVSLLAVIFILSRK
ncbi:MAG: hypothetical protein NE334_20185 [Lentisphaeraceae bacterium]|nr:hypothetical protein [Lentisphaeraceae bacterium]